MLFSLENKLNIRNYQSGPLGAYNIPDIQAIQLQYLQFLLIAYALPNMAPESYFCHLKS